MSSINTKAEARLAMSRYLLQRASSMTTHLSNREEEKQEPLSPRRKVWPIGACPFDLMSGILRRMYNVDQTSGHGVS